MTQCEHLFVQRLLSDEFREAIKDGSYAIAYELARGELPDLDLSTAPGRVLDEGEPVLFDALAARWIIIALEARRLTLHELGWPAERFMEAPLSHRIGEQALWTLLR